MTKNIKSLGIDVGKLHIGFAFIDDFEEITTHYTFQSLLWLKSEVLSWIDRYNPDIVISCRPIRFIPVVAFQSKLIAIIELCCQIREVPFYEGIDSQCKKEVIGSGSAKKDDILIWAASEYGFDNITQDEADALMMAAFARTFSST
jgi:Holliday junction resolvasome RuvABC endonuclease subunit